MRSSQWGPQPERARVLARVDSHLAAGTGAGVLTAFALHPLDTIKTRLQVADAHAPAGGAAARAAGSALAASAAGAAAPAAAAASRRGRAILDAALSIARVEGARGFYRGVAAAAWGSGLSWGLYFFFYEGAKGRLRAASAAAAARPLTTLEQMYCAWESGSIVVLLTNPLWLLKTRLQLARPGGPAGYAGGTLAAVRTIAAEEGVRGLYRGVQPALLLTSHGMIQFGLYEYFKEAHPLRGVARLAGAAVRGAPAGGGGGAAGGGAGAPDSTSLLAYGALSKAAAVTVTYPYQVIKARLQARPPSPPYGGAADCARRLWQDGGAAAFYRGFGANILRVAPQSALTLVSYEAIRSGIDAARAVEA